MPTALMTETEYWNDYSLTQTDIVSAIESFYTYVEIHNYAAESKAIYRRMNAHPTFWNIQLHGLQTTFFITLSRIFDGGRDAHSIHKLLAATLAHPQFFSKAALARRKSDGDGEPEWLADYIANAFEPQVSDLRGLKRALAPYKVKYEQVYGDIRDYVFAHKILKDRERVTDLFAKTKIGELDEILYFLNDLMEALWQLFQNGRKPELGVRTYDYRKRIKETTRGVLEGMLPGT